MGEAGNKTKPPHAFEHPHSSGRKQDVNNTEDAAEGPYATHLSTPTA